MERVDPLTFAVTAVKIAKEKLVQQSRCSIASHVTLSVFLFLNA